METSLPTSKLKVVALISGTMLATIILLLALPLPSHSNRVMSSVELEKAVTLHMTQCTEADHVSECLKIAAKDLLDKAKLTGILSILKKNEKTPEYFTHCHQLTHYLGQEAYKRIGSIPSVYSESNEACLGGVYHGAIEGYFMARKITIDGEENSDTLIGSEVSKICGNREDYKKVQEFIECSHGLGHAMMYVTDGDLIRALHLCDNAPAKDEREHCYTGALMQNNDSINDPDHPSKYAKEDDVMYPCYILDKLYQPLCYTYGVLTRFQNDVKGAVHICETVPKEYERGCFQTYGRDRTMLTFDPKEIESQCEIISNEEYKHDCIRSAAYNLVIRFGLSSPLAFELCSLDPEATYSCFSRLAQASKTQTRDIKMLNNFCERIPEDKAKQECLR